MEPSHIERPRNPNQLSPTEPFFCGDQLSDWSIRGLTCRCGFPSPLNLKLQALPRRRHDWDRFTVKKRDVSIRHRRSCPPVLGAVHHDLLALAEINDLPRDASVSIHQTDGWDEPFVNRTVSLWGCSPPALTSPYVSLTVQMSRLQYAN